MPPWPIGPHPVVWRRGILWRLLGFVAPCLAAGCVGACFRLPQQAVMWFNLVIAILQQSLLEQASPKCVISRCLHRGDRCRMERRGCLAISVWQCLFPLSLTGPAVIFNLVSSLRLSQKKNCLPQQGRTENVVQERESPCLILFTGVFLSCGLKFNNSLRSLTPRKRAGLYSEAGI